MTCNTDHEWGDGKAAYHMGNVHHEMMCDDCDWYEGDYLQALARARKHHEETGHNLHGERVLFVRVGSAAHDLVKAQTRALLGIKEETA